MKYAELRRQNESLQSAVNKWAEATEAEWVAHNVALRDAVHETGDSDQNFKEWQEARTALGEAEEALFNLSALAKARGES